MTRMGTGKYKSGWIIPQRAQGGGNEVGAGCIGSSRKKRRVPEAIPTVDIKGF